MKSEAIQKLMLKEDSRFLSDMTRKLNYRPTAIREGYEREFRAGMASEPVDYKKDNVGRRQANLWLLKLEAQK